MSTPQIPGDIGYGLMGLTRPSLRGPDSQIFPVLDAALETGATFWNTATFYGMDSDPLANLKIIARYLEAHPEATDKIFLSIKAFVNLPQWTPNNSPENIKEAIEAAEKLLKPLGKKLDLVQPARVDPNIPIDETIKLLAEYVKEGRIGSIGLSEVNAATIRRAHAIHPIAAVEVEVSLWTREIFSNGVADTCAELGIPIIAYSPLGQGFLSARWKSLDDLPADDHRRHFERFQNWEENKAIVEKVEGIAKEKGVSTAQVCIAWLRWKASTVKGLRLLPLPGAGSVERVRENNNSVDVKAEALEGLDRFMDEVAVKGIRYNKYAAEFLEG